MTYLPARPDLEQLRHQSEDLLRRALSSLLAEDPDLAVSPMLNWTDHRLGANPLNYIAMIGFDHERLGLPADLAGTGRSRRP